MLKERAGSGALRVVELAGEFELDLLAVNTFVAKIEVDAELTNQGSDVGCAATRERQVAIKIREASDDARRTGD